MVLAIGLIGDLNLDGKVDSADALQVLRYDVGKTTFDSLQKIAGNINVDSRIDSADALQILRYDVGKIVVVLQRRIRRFGKPARAEYFESRVFDRLFDISFRVP